MLCSFGTSTEASAPAVLSLCAVLMCRCSVHNHYIGLVQCRVFDNLYNVQL